MGVSKKRLSMGNWQKIKKRITKFTNNRRHNTQHTASLRNHYTPLVPLLILSNAYLFITLGAQGCVRKNCRTLSASRFETSRSIQPHALCINGCGWWRKRSHSCNVGANCSDFISGNVATMAIRFSQRLALFDKSEIVSLLPIFRQNAPTMCGADKSTKSQLFTCWIWRQ